MERGIAETKLSCVWSQVVHNACPSELRVVLVRGEAVEEISGKLQAQVCCNIALLGNFQSWPRKTNLETN